MEKLIFLLFIAQISLVSCSKNFCHDNVVLFDGDTECVEGNFTRGGPQRQVGDFFNGFVTPGLWTPTDLPENSQCKADMNDIFREAEKLNIWALKILDASAKIPSGILNGNLNQFGDFDQCINSQGYSKNNLIIGKYCLANIEVKFDKNDTINTLRILDAVVHSHRMLTNELKDEGHRIPRFETFNFGICIPASCNSQQIENALNDNLDKIFKDSFLRVKAAVSDEVCYIKEEERFSVIRLAVVSLFLVTLLLTILGTAMDINKVPIDSKSVRIIRCFSLKRSWSIFVSTSSSADELRCLHGGRFLNALALLLSHKQIAMLFNPVLNRTAMTESFSKSWTMIGRSAILYTDSFLLFSGLLASYSLIKDLDNRKGIKFKEKLINRIVRFAPNLYCVILFCTYIMDAMGSGPQWGLVVTKYTNLCKSNMWRNFLFIHNYFGFENMCLTHTHQLGIDMQLFLVSPIFIYMIWKSPKVGFLLISTVSAVSTWLRYDITYKNNLSTLLYYGISVDQLWRTANLSYILPTHRLTVYLVGIFLGYYLRRGGKNLCLNSFLVTCGWILATGAGVLAIFGPNHAALKEYVYNAKDAAQFNAFAPILWTIFVSWGILACVNGYGGVFNDFLCWKYFTVFTRISYALYLTQFPVFFYNVGIERSVQYYKGFHSLFDIMELGAILVASLLLTLLYDIPFQELKKALSSKPSSVVQNTNKNEHCDSIRQEQIRQKGRKRLQSFGT